MPWGHYAYFRKRPEILFYIKYLGQSQKIVVRCNVRHPDKLNLVSGLELGVYSILPAITTRNDWLKFAV